MSQFKIDFSKNPVPSEKLAEILKNPGFGTYFTDHVASIKFEKNRGWYDHSVIPFTDLDLNPAAAVLHYGQEIFEGLKAYRHDDDSIWLFRPERNAKRFVNSARRLAMEPLAESDFIDAVTELVKVDKNWVPKGANEQSLYIRPFEIADEPYLGVRSAKTYRFIVLCTPVGAYYPDPVQLWVTPNFTRAAEGGTGTAKCGGNYAGSLAAQAEAEKNGYGQVLYLDGSEHKWIEESGTMNFMMVTSGRELVTPALGSILPGITRESLLAIADKHGLNPVERKISIDELKSGVTSGEITELFCCGTAAVITPITGFGTPSQKFLVADGKQGPKTKELRDHLLNIQYGRTADIFGWTRQVV